MNSHYSYRSTHINWIGDIPSHWSIRRLKYLTQVRKELSEHGDEELLSVTESRGIVKRKELRNTEENISRSENLSGYRLVRKGDLVNNIMLVWKRGLGVSQYEGIVSPAYSVFSFNSDCDPYYFNYLLRSDEYISEFRRHSTGITMSRLRLYDDSFGNVFAHLPPIEEQKLISQYLDKKTSQIDSLVEKIQKKIELLKEQRTSLINHYVTKGLDPNVEMKDSGIEWIGEIPKHWKISKLKFEMEIHNNKRIPLSAEERGQREGPYPYYGSTSLIDHVDDYLFDGRYILIAEDGANLVMRNLRLSFIVDGKFWVNNHAHILKSKDHSFDEYYCELLEQTDFTTVITGSAQPKLTLEAIKETPLCVPPKHEMDQITGKIQTVLSDFNNLIELTNKKRKLLVEYRQSLISSVVTGKVRVMEDMI